MEPELTWDWWARSVDNGLFAPDGQQAVTWALDTIRGFFGESWLGENAAQSGHVPLLSFEWWPPLSNSRILTRVIELAVRIALVARNSVGPDLLDEAKAVYANQDLTAAKFQHLCLLLETAAFAILAGWSVSYEETGNSGRRPDLAMRRGAVRYSVEVTTLGLDREFRAVNQYCDILHSRLRVLELEHGIEVACRALEILPGAELTAWLDELARAARLTAADGKTRTVSHGENKAVVFAAGQRPIGQVFSGPMISTEAWRRVGTRISEKASQTVGSAAWLRIDDIGALFRLTDRGTQPPGALLKDLQGNAKAALADAPHVRGIILGGGTLIDPGTARDETAWGPPGPAALITPGPPRHVLADGPSAMTRRLPGGRSRLTFILPSPHPNLILPPGTGLEPGLWYHNEPTWLNQALQALGHHRLTASFATNRRQTNRKPRSLSRWKRSIRKDAK